MSALPDLEARIARVEALGPTLKRFTLEHPAGGELPPAPAGAHLLLTLHGRERVWRNAYSLTCAPEERRAYTIVVRKVENSRGGSVFMHQGVEEGTVLKVTGPANLFPLSNVARKHLLVSGGIGITPFLSYLALLRARPAAVELHHFCRGVDATSFAELLRPFAGLDVHVHPDRLAADELPPVLAHQPLGTHLYTCGPQPLMDIVIRAARTAGWPAARIHTESFGGAAGGRPFKVRLARSDREIDVPADRSFLESLEAAGVEVPCLCRGGVCGECRTELLEGEPEHRDDFLTEEEHASGRAIMPCVSRARSDLLVIDR